MDWLTPMRHETYNMHVPGEKGLIDRLRGCRRHCVARSVRGEQVFAECSDRDVHTAYLEAWKKFLHEQNSSNQAPLLICKGNAKEEVASSLSCSFSSSHGIEERRQERATLFRCLCNRSHVIYNPISFVHELKCQANASVVERFAFATNKECECYLYYDSCIRKVESFATAVGKRAAKKMAFSLLLERLVRQVVSEDDTAALSLPTTVNEFQDKSVKTRRHNPISLLHEYRTKTHARIEGLEVVVDGGFRWTWSYSKEGLVTESARATRTTKKFAKRAAAEELLRKLKAVP